MVLKNVFAALFATLLLAWRGPALADEYRPDELLTLDPFKALLSPKRLGPSTHFAPVQVEARTDLGIEARPVRVKRIADVQIVRGKKRPMTRGVKFARDHRSALDAQAFDTRIVVWPCRSGGICNWKPWVN
ncbi:MAG TPA: hypothetical protein VFH41_00770 [Bradyrhizobium sp.]|nr:hypothetical protein [Bradyrhizobium sp.]